MALATRSSNRQRNPPQIYTPSRDNKSNTNMSYKLNTKKTLQKKIDASERRLDCEIQYKSGTIVITCSAAAYEVLKQAIYDHYNGLHDKVITISTKAAKLDNQETRATPVIVEESISVKNKQGRTSRQLYRINMFNTSSRIDANGYKLEEFIHNHLQQICNKIKDMVDFNALNTKIAEICRKTMGSLPEKTKPMNKISHKYVQDVVDKSPTNQAANEKSPANRSTTHHSTPDQRIENRLKALEASNNTIMKYNMIQTTDERDDDVDLYDRDEVLESSYELICRQCKEAIEGNEIANECHICTSWYHATCTSPPQEDDDYICPMCTALDETARYCNNTSTNINKDAEIDISTTRRDDGIEPCYIVEMETPKIPTITRTPIIKQDAEDYIGQETNPKYFIEKEMANRNENHLGNETKTQNAPKPATPMKQSNGEDAQVFQIATPAKTKMKKTKKKEPTISDRTLAMEIELAECKARITMLEETNKDYQNTIRILTTKMGMILNEHHTENENSQLMSMQNKLGELEYKICGKIDAMKKEMEYKSEMRDIQMKHLMEMTDMKIKISMLETREKLTSRVPHELFQGSYKNQEPDAMGAQNSHTTPKKEIKLPTPVNYKNQEHMDTESHITRGQDCYASSTKEANPPKLQNHKEQTPRSTQNQQELETISIPEPKQLRPNEQEPLPIPVHIHNRYSNKRQNNVINYQISVPKPTSPNNMRDRNKQNNQIRRRNGEYRTLNLQQRNCQRPMERTTNGKSSYNQNQPFLGAGRATTVTWRVTSPTQELDH